MVSARVVSAVEDGGRLVARKRSRDKADAARLVHEAEVLGWARHPGVVELVTCEPDGDAVVLSTDFVGTHSFETLGRVPVERATGLVAAVAETIADLHELGVVHGRLDPSHVLVGGDGRPILCGFAGGGRVATTPPPGPPHTPGFCDPAAPSDATLSPAADVYGLGCLLRWLIEDGQQTDIEPIPDRRFTVSRVRASWSGFHRRALLTLADHATDEVASRRPPARRLAQDLLDTVPTAALVDVPASADRKTFLTRHRITALAVLGVAATVGVLGVGALRGSGSAATPNTREVDIPSSTTVTTVQVTTTALPVTTASEASCTSAAPVADDLDGDGCGDPVHVEDGRVIVVGTARFTAGEAGDRVAVGDWDCDGTATVAVLRPSSGAVFVFDEWATALSDISVPPRATVPGAVNLQAREHGNGCTTLVALRTDGTEQEIA